MSNEQVWINPDTAHRRRALVFAGRGTVLLCTAALLASGCQAPGNVEYERQLQLQRDTIARQKDELAAQKTTIDALTQRLDTARAIKSEDLEKIFYPVELVIDKLSGGYDADGKPGHDGVVVYLKPVDATGDVLKVAGEIRIQLYDLAAPPTQNLLGEYVIPVEQARDLWYGKLMAYHYAVKCPWPHRPPLHPEITIRAIFIDYLTQRVISAQSTCKVQLTP